jgi:hypothetical protein
VQDITFSADGKAIAYRADLNGDWCTMLVMNNKLYVGTLLQGKKVYLEEKNVMIE